MKIINRFIFIVLVLSVSSACFAQKFLRCHSIPNPEYPDSFALVYGMIEMYAECKDFRKNQFLVSFKGNALGAGGSLTGEIEMTENWTMDAKKYFMMSCPFTKKNRFNESQTFYFATVETGVFFEIIAGLGLHSKGSPCLITGAGAFMVGAMAEFSQVTVTPIIQI